MRGLQWFGCRSGGSESGYFHLGCRIFTAWVEESPARMVHAHGDDSVVRVILSLLNEKAALPVAQKILCMRATLTNTASYSHPHNSCCFVVLEEKNGQFIHRIGPHTK
jgi:hypothetical protein